MDTSPKRHLFFRLCLAYIPCSTSCGDVFQCSDVRTYLPRSQEDSIWRTILPRARASDQLILLVLQTVAASRFNNRYVTLLIQRHPRDELTSFPFSVCPSISSSTASPPSFPTSSTMTHHAISSRNPRRTLARRSIVQAFELRGINGSVVFTDNTFHIKQVMNTSGLVNCDIEIGTTRTATASSSRSSGPCSWRARAQRQHERRARQRDVDEQVGRRGHVERARGHDQLGGA